MIYAELIKYSPSEVKPYMKIILSVPAEHAQSVIQELGYPTPGESIWVEVKKLDEVPPYVRSEM